MHVVAPDHAAQLLEDQDQAVGEQHLVEVVAFIEAADHQPFQCHAEYDGKRNADEDRRQQVARQAGQRPGEVGADHVEAAMGKIDDAHDAEDQRQSAGDEKQQQAVLQAIQKLDKEEGEIHRTDAKTAAETCRRSGQ